VDAGEADPLCGAVQNNVDVAMRAHRQLVLADLIALGQVGIKIIFAGENAFASNFTVSRQSRFDRELDNFFIQDW
jgi:hypothetical protein